MIGVILIWRPDPVQASDPGDVDGTIAIAEEAVVADAMQPFGRDMDQDPADGHVGLQGHGGMPPEAVEAVILDAGGDALVVHTAQAAVGNRDAPLIDCRAISCRVTEDASSPRPSRRRRTSGTTYEARM